MGINESYYLDTARAVKTDEQIRHHDERIGILIKMMDERIRRNLPNGEIQ